MIRWTRSFRCCESGAIAIEYSLLAGMLALLIIAAVTQIGSGVVTFLQGVAQAL